MPYNVLCMARCVTMAKSPQLKIKLNRMKDNKGLNETKQCDIHVVSGSATDFYTDLMKLINAYCKKGLKKPDLVHKMEYATESCKLS